jgi:hypothetical protein
MEKEKFFAKPRNPEKLQIDENSGVVLTPQEAAEKREKMKKESKFPTDP